jgi:hypothetical protein
MVKVNHRALRRELALVGHGGGRGVSIQVPIDIETLYGSSIHLEPQRAMASYEAIK